MQINTTRSKLLDEQLDSLMGQHGAGELWAALAQLCIHNANDLKDRRPHVPAIWEGWVGMFAGMARQAEVLYDPWSGTGGQ